MAHATECRRPLSQNIETDPGSFAICKATIRLSADLCLDVVAEGVETREQLFVLKRIRCPVIQGYYFSKPLPSEALIRFVIQNKAECSVGAELGKSSHKHRPETAIHLGDEMRVATG